MEPLSELPSKYKLTTLPTKIRLGREWLILANTLAYYVTVAATITTVKSFIIQTPGACIIKVVTDVISVFLL